MKDIWDKIGSKKSLTKTAIFLLPFVTLLAGIATGVEIEKQHNYPKFSPIRSSQDGFPLIRPLVGFDISETQDFPEFSKVKRDLNEYIGKAKIKGTLESVGIYVRTIENGHWFGINENKQYTPGSLLKVPIMIAYFKKAEADPKILSQKVVYRTTAKSDEQNLIEAPSVLQSGKSYTIKQIIEAMIIDSDNGAMNFLVSNVELNYINEVFQDFGIRIPSDEEYLLSAKEVAVFFRRLHNATYLNREYSEEALEILNQVKFKGGVDSAANPGVSVAHKYGERGVREDGQLVGVELHDCGIVYAERRYLVCIMTRGRDVDVLKNEIAQMSQIISKRILEL